MLPQSNLIWVALILITCYPHAVADAFVLDHSYGGAQLPRSTTHTRRQRSSLQQQHPALGQALLSAQLQPTAHEEDEWHPHDPAWTTSQLLKGLWSQIAQAKDMVKGVRAYN